MSKAGDSDATFGYSIEVGELLDQPKGIDYSAVLWVDQHGPDGVVRIWERPTAQGSA